MIVERERGTLSGWAMLVVLLAAILVCGWLVVTTGVALGQHSALGSSFAPPPLPEELLSNAVDGG